MRFLLIAMLLFVSLKSTSQAQKDTGKQSVNLKEEFNKFREKQSKGGLSQDTVLYQIQQLANEQFKTEMALEKQKQKEVEDDNYAMQHRWRSFDFQYTASIVIFILVVVIVVCGLFFSAWQFRITMQQLQLKEAFVKASQKLSATVSEQQVAGTGAEKKEESEPANPAIPISDLSSLKNELEVSASGIKVNSSVLGVIILVISIVFFYLYILYVYPIKYLSPAPAPAKADTATLKVK